MEWNGGMEQWNGTVEWNSGMTTPIERLVPDELSPISIEAFGECSAVLESFRVSRRRVAQSDWLDALIHW